MFPAKNALAYCIQLRVPLIVNRGLGVLVVIFYLRTLASVLRLEGVVASALNMLLAALVHAT